MSDVQASKGKAAVNQSPFLLAVGVVLIAAGILSAFQVSGVWVLLLLVAFGGGGLFFVVWGGSRQS